MDDNLFTDDLTFTGSAADAISQTSAPNTNTTQPVVTNSNGQLSKSVDTAGDLAAILNAGAKVIGTIYPSGQNNPAAVTSANQSAAVTQARTTNTLLIVGGAILVVAVLAFTLKK